MPVGDGDFDNIWDETPDFVIKAKQIAPNYPPKTK
jgi:hypothetical protein